MKYTCVFLAVLTIGGQQSNKPRPPQPEQTFPTMTSALETIATRYGTHLGLEYAPNDPDRVPVTLKFSEETIDAVLNSLIAQKPKYTWREIDGVYDLYPIHAGDSLLKVHVHSFIVDNMSLETASRAITELPEIKTWLMRHGVRRHELELGPGRKSSIRVSLTLKEIPLRSILNHLVQKTGGTNWVVVRYGSSMQYIAIYF